MKTYIVIVLCLIALLAVALDVSHPWTAKAAGTVVVKMQRLSAGETVVVPAGTVVGFSCTSAECFLATQTEKQ